MELAGGDGGFGEEGGLRAEFLIGKLKEKVGGEPVGEEGFFLIEGCGLAEEIEKGPGSGLGDDDGALAGIAERFEEAKGCLAQGRRGEGGERGLEGGAEGFGQLAARQGREF